ncbi:MAG: GHKL domain-containing protein, partial [Chitinivibrionales bacterium]|nr:GHKL domain-containing protein [Chitinivibrionales bacterium]MBD3358466.1 GHKL domain-containing protein [Chitinivibrionales bacterium]
CDPRLVRIAMENLLDNAWKYSSQKLNARIEFGVRYENGTEIYYVADNGVGFDMASAYKVFAPFQRLHGSSEYPGTGIGLATVQRVIRRHGGDIRADSTPGRGTTFSFTLVENTAP